MWHSLGITMTFSWYSRGILVVFSWPSLALSDIIKHCLSLKHLLVIETLF